MALDLTKLSDAFTKFAGDFSTFKTDLAAFLATIVPADPAQQTAIDGFATQLSDLDASVQTMDASLKPPTA